MRESPEQQRKVVEWRDAAVADGWSIAPTYAPTETIEQSATLEKDGFKAQILTRDNVNPRSSPNKICEYTIFAWGPDRLSVRITFPYDWERIKASLTTCPECKRAGIPTERVGFANRVCAECAPALRKRIETPGWTR
jgi:hypothetical protein